MESFICSRANLKIVIETLKQEWLVVKDVTASQAELDLAAKVENLALNPENPAPAVPGYEVRRDSKTTLLRVCLVAWRRKTDFPGFAECSDYTLARLGDGSLQVKNPWYSPDVAAYLEANFLECWALLSFTPIQLVRSAKGVHCYKTNNLCESVIRQNKDLDKIFNRGKGSSSFAEFLALKGIDDFHRFSSLARGIVKSGTHNLVLNPTHQVTAIDVTETQWSKTGNLSFGKLSEICPMRLLDYQTFLCAWVTSTSTTEILRSIPDRLRADATTLLVLLVDSAAHLKETKRLNVAGTKAYQKLYRVITQMKMRSTLASRPREKHDAVVAVLDAFANSRKQLSCIKASFDYSAVIELKVTLSEHQCGAQYSASCVQKRLGKSAATDLVHVCPKLVCKCSTMVCSYCMEQWALAKHCIEEHKRQKIS